MQKNGFSKSNIKYVKQLVTAALFCALAYVAMFATSWIKVSFLTFDAKDTVITIAGLLFGPLYALAISFTVSFIEFITIGDTGIYGFVMNFLSSAAFSTVCALIYKYKKTMKGAVISLVSSVFAMTAIMLLFNLFITPRYMHVPMETVAKMIPTLFLPFNLTKGMLNAALVLVLYKPASRAMKIAKVLPQEADATVGTTADAKERHRRNLVFSLVVTATGLATAAICLVVFFVFLGGSIAF